MDNTDASSAEKHQEHIAGSYCYKVIGIDDKIRKANKCYICS